MTEDIDRSDELLDWYAEDRIDGTELLDDLHDTLTQYVVFPDEHAAVAVTLYIAATHAQPAWEHATRLVIKSPLKRCGKSRLQEIIAETCHRPLRTANCSTAALVRSIGSDDPPTILLDEADTVFGGRKAAKDSVAEDLRGFINAGHSRGAPYLRWDMNSRSLEECPTFAMAVIGGIGDMPDTIEDRGVVVAMRRRASGETVDQFRRRSIPALHELRERLATWIREHLNELRTAEPAMPVQDRAADTWEPLVAVADLAGGSWPERARTACTVMTGGEADDPDSAGERLLADLYSLWSDEPVIFTADLLDRLHKLDESPWADWYGKPLTDRGLANLLRPYGVKSRSVRIAEATSKGYRRDDLTDPWARYVPRPTAVTSVTASQADERPSITSGNGCDASVTDNRSPSVTPPELDKQATCDAVTDVTHNPGENSHTPPTPASMPQQRHRTPSPQPRQRHRTIQGRPTSAYPSCIVCGKPVMAGQGDTHLSCSKQEAAS